MILDAIIDEQVYSLNIPETLRTQAHDFYDQLDRDMDQGWQMSRDWVAAPDRIQRGQIVADKLLTALESQNEKLGLLMAGYLLSRLPGLKAVELDIQGEIQNNLFHFHADTDSEKDAQAHVVSGKQHPIPDENTPEPRPAEPETSHTEILAAAQDCTQAPHGLSKLNAMTQAGQDISQVFKVGKGYRFSVFDHASQSWHDGPLVKTREEADHLRQQAFSYRYEALQSKH